MYIQSILMLERYRIEQSCHDDSLTLIGGYTNSALSTRFRLPFFMPSNDDLAKLYGLWDTFQAIKEPYLALSCMHIHLLYTYALLLASIISATDWETVGL
jgi:hypothetical protein